MMEVLGSSRDHALTASCKGLGAFATTPGGWTSEEIEIGQSMLDDGRLMKDIASALGRSFDSVNSRLRHYARAVRERRLQEARLAPIHSFRDILARFPAYGDAAGWMGVERRSAKSMAGRDWIPRQYWPGLLKGLAEDCGIILNMTELEQLAEQRGRWERAAPAPKDWSNLPAMETSIAKIVNRRIRDRALADEAAGHAILEMMEYAQPHLGYGVRCAFNYVVDSRRSQARMPCLSDDELQAAMDIRVTTAPNQIPSLQLSDVMRAARDLPHPYDKVFPSLVRQDDNKALAARLGVTEATAGIYRAHTRMLLRHLVEDDDLSVSESTDGPESPGLNQEQST